MTGKCTDDISLKVSCYAGYRGEEEPRRFFLGQRPVDVVEVIDRWTAPEYRYFKCRSSDGDVYILRQDMDRLILIEPPGGELPIVDQSICIGIDGGEFQGPDLGRRLPPEFLQDLPELLLVDGSVIILVEALEYTKEPFLWLCVCLSHRVTHVGRIRER